MKKVFFALMLAMAMGLNSRADIIVSEVVPWGSAAANTPYTADWFEITNTGASAVDITGWRWDDNSNDFAQSSALLGVTSIAAGQSVVFLDSNSDAAIATAFTNSWFGSNVPSGFALGSYNGPGLGTGGDAVNIFNSAGALQTRVQFGASSAGPAFASFDNAQGLTGNISLLSQVGVNGAFTAFSSLPNTSQIGSPGSISAVPEPASILLLGSIAGVGALLRRRWIRS